MRLYAGSPYWLLKHGLGVVVPPLDRDLRCGVAIVGSGITGALVTDALAREGRSVVLLDARDLAHGSTAASTALLQYDLDVPLHRLSAMIGDRDAGRAYTLGVEAIGELEALSRALSCGVERRPSLYFSRDERALPALLAEFAARRAAGLDVEFVPAPELKRRWGMHGAGAIRSRVAAEADPVALTTALLRRAAKNGAVLHDRTAVTRLVAHRGGVRLHTDRGPMVRASHAVWATGYEAAAALPRGLVELRSTFALASEPVRIKGREWRDRATMWEFAEPYLYARRADDRVIVGGEDVGYRGDAARDRLIDRKVRVLVRKFRALMPGIALEPAFAWAGTFATTPDGMGYIGSLGPRGRVMYALGFGGNGITCGVIASRLIVDALAGRKNPDARLFRIGR